MPEINDLLSAAIGNSPVDFASTVSDILGQKAIDAIGERRIEIAQSLYGEPDSLDIGIGDIDLDADLEGLMNNDQDS